MEKITVKMHLNQKWQVIANSIDAFDVKIDVLNRINEIQKHKKKMNGFSIEKCAIAENVFSRSLERLYTLSGRTHANETIAKVSNAV